MKKMSVIIILVCLCLFTYIAVKHNTTEESIAVKLTFNGSTNTMGNSYDCHFTWEIENKGEKVVQFNEDDVIIAELRNVDTNQIYKCVESQKKQLSLMPKDKYEQSISYMNIPSGNYHIKVTSVTLNDTSASFTKEIEIK